MDVLATPCEQCGAGAGEPCVSPRGDRVRSHLPRRRAKAASRTAAREAFDRAQQAREERKAARRETKRKGRPPVKAKGQAKQGRPPVKAKGQAKPVPGRQNVSPARQNVTLRKQAPDEFGVALRRLKFAVRDHEREDTRATAAQIKRLERRIDAIVDRNERQDAAYRRESSRTDGG